jgi:hypothetical protein
MFPMAFARWRTTRPWFLCGLSVLFGLVMVFGAIFTGVRGWIAFASGGATTATVRGESGDQRHLQYQVTFTTLDGSARTEWMDRAPGEDLRVGDQVRIRYDRAHPGNLYAASDLSDTLIAVPLIILTIGLFFLLFIPATLGAAETSTSADPVEDSTAASCRRLIGRSAGRGGG